MAYRVLYKGLEVTCDTVQDVDALASSAIPSDPAVAPRQQRGDAPRSAGHNGKPVVHRSVSRLIRDLNTNQITVLTMLAKSEDAVEDAALRSKLGLQDNKGLAGVLAGISKRAKSAGLSPGAIITKSESRSADGDRTYSYSITADVLDEVRVAVGV